MYLILRRTVFFGLLVWLITAIHLSLYLKLVIHPLVIDRSSIWILLNRIHFAILTIFVWRLLTRVHSTHFGRISGSPGVWRRSYSQDYNLFMGVGPTVYWGASRGLPTTIHDDIRCDELVLGFYEWSSKGFYWASEGCMYDFTDK